MNGPTRLDSGNNASTQQSLTRILTLTRVDDDTFVGGSRQGSLGRKFGGEVAGQAAIAAGLTVDGERVLHSAHIHFLLQGDGDAPVTYRVTSVRDGRSFSLRQVDGHQDGHLICSMTASFHVEPSPTRDAFAHQESRDEVTHAGPGPGLETVFADDPAGLEWILGMSHRGSVDFGFLRPPNRVTAERGVSAPTDQQIWIRSSAALPADDLVNRAAVLYMSDYLLLSVAASHHAVVPQDPTVQFATLDHSVYFHRSPRADDWILHDQVTPWAGRGRAVCRGSMFDLQGSLIATTFQEGVLRRLPILL